MTKKQGGVKKRDSIFAHWSDFSSCGVWTVLARNSAGGAVPARGKEILGLGEQAAQSAFLPLNLLAEASGLHDASEKRR
jgi:hypothetical protein